MKNDLNNDIYRYTEKTRIYNVNFCFRSGIVYRDPEEFFPSLYKIMKDKDREFICNIFAIQCQQIYEGREIKHIHAPVPGIREIDIFRWGKIEFSRPLNVYCEYRLDSSSMNYLDEDEFYFSNCIIMNFDHSWISEK